MPWSIQPRWWAGCAPPCAPTPPGPSRGASSRSRGCVLPIIEVAGLDEAIAFINERDKPLALYAFTGNESTRRRLVVETTSGALSFSHRRSDGDERVRGDRRGGPPPGTGGRGAARGRDRARRRDPGRPAPQGRRDGPVRLHAAGRIWRPGRVA